MLNLGEQQTRGKETKEEKVLDCNYVQTIGKVQSYGQSDSRMCGAAWTVRSVYDGLNKRCPINLWDAKSKPRGQIKTIILEPDGFNHTRPAGIQ